MSNPNDYTVGWICAITTEYVAAQVFLDNQHEGPVNLSPSNDNAYILGKIGKHNVVISFSPYGTGSTTAVADNMLRSFPNIRIWLSVGIGAGVPSQKHDIRLGDIVVSTPRDGDGGMIQLPTVLLKAVTDLESRYKIKGHRLQESINKILENNPKLQQTYKRPGPWTDRLFEAGTHESPSYKVARPERTRDEDNPAVHYGLIASGHQVLRNVSLRDAVGDHSDVLCFEMEAAGPMNHFPCLAIRGICDYADFHRTEEWHGYSALTAAAFTKDLLEVMSPAMYNGEAESSTMERSAVSSGLNSQSQPISEGNKGQRPTPSQNSTLQIDESFASSMPSMLTKFRFFYRIYGTCSILLFLCRSEEAWWAIHKKLHCGGCGEAFWKSQNHNCAMAGLGATIVALIAITSMLLPFTDQVHWITRALWIVSILSAFLSVLFVCKHQMIIGHLVLIEEHQRHQKNHEGSSHTNDLLREGSNETTPRLSAVLLFSISRAFFDYALVAYIIGLGTYLGFVWQYNLDAQAGHFDSRNIFIVFMVYIGFCICAYCLPTYPKPCEWPWSGNSKAIKDPKDGSRSSRNNLDTTGVANV